MISKRIISEIRSLQITKYRNEKRLFAAEGEKVVKELLESDYKIKYLAALPSYLDNTKLPADLEVFEVNEDELSKISSLSKANQVVAIAEIPSSEKFVIDDKVKLYLLGDKLNDPGNLGTIIRTAEWFGVMNLIFSVDSVDCYNSKVVQSAMGSLFRVNINYLPLEEVINEGKKNNFRICCASMDGNPVKDILKSDHRMLVIGNESHGISSAILKLADEKILVSKASDSKTESLNAAVACGILLSQLSK